MVEFILQFIFFCIAYPMLCLWQWNDRKHRKENYEHKLNEAAVKGDKESATRYTEALTKMK